MTNATELDVFIRRLGAALFVLTGPDGADVAHRAVQRARRVADIDSILTHTHY